MIKTLKQIFPYTPVIFLIVLAYYFFVNCLYYDEITPIAFVYNTINFPNLKSIFSEIIAPHNEHIIVFVKIIFLFDYFIHQGIQLKDIAIFSILIETAILVLLKRYLKLNFIQLSIISFSIFLPFFTDIYFYTLSIVNIIIVLFVLLSLIEFKKNNINISMIYLFCSILNSAQGLLFLPIWLFFLILKKGKLYQFLLPICFVVIYLIHVKTSNPAHETNPFLEFMNFEKMKKLWTYLSPPYNNSSILIQLFSFCFYIVTLIKFLKVLIKNKFDFNSDYYNEITIGLLMWSTLCLLSAFFIRIVMENRYFFYSALNFSILTIIYLKSKKKSEYINFSILSLVIVHLIFNYLYSWPNLKNIYLERRFINQNFKNNLIGNYLPSEEFRKKLDYLMINKNQKLTPRRFEIPSGINGSIPSHLMVFYDFIPYSFLLIQKEKDLPLKIRNLRTYKTFKLINQNITLKPILKIKITGSNFSDIFLAKFKSGNYTLTIPLTEEHNHIFRLHLFNNQLPLKDFEVSILKGNLKI